MAKKMKQQTATPVEVAPAAVAEQVTEQPKLVIELPAAASATKWVLRVRGEGCGRGRYVTCSAGLDPWKFHAVQYGTKAEADADCKVANAQLPEQLKADVVPFANAWFEKL
jgi:hypothetical protein